MLFDFHYFVILSIVAIRVGDILKVNEQPLSRLLFCLSPFGDYSETLIVRLHSPYLGFYRLKSCGWRYGVLPFASCEIILIVIK
jgi:hypothetical protein